MKTKLITYSLGIALVIAVASPIFAQRTRLKSRRRSAFPISADAPSALPSSPSLPETCSTATRNGTGSLFQRNLVEPTGFEPVTSSSHRGALPTELRPLYL